ncbi:MAG: tetratricopeptide repeat protein [Phycisphaerae bacterium]|nr:tetratricopeptide repeat protein [Phycisphaerae bacterium]
MKRHFAFLILLILFLPCLGQVPRQELKEADKARFGLAQSLNNLKRFDESGPMLEDLHTRYPDNAKIVIELVRALGYGKSADRVIPMLEDMERRHGDDYEIKITLANIFYEIGDIAGAKEKFTEIVEKNPQDARTLSTLAEILAVEGDYAGAAELCRKVLSIEPGNNLARLWLARIESWSKQYDSSIAIYEDIIRDDPNAVVPRREMARVLGWDRKYDEALKAYQELLDRTDAEPAARYEMESKRNLYNKFDMAAIGRYEKWLELEPNNPEAMFDLGQIYSWQMQWDNAKTMYEQLLKQTGGHSMAKQALSKVDICSKAAQLKTGFEITEADSSGRLTDRKSWDVFTSVTKPLNENYQLRVQEDSIWYRFKDVKQIYRQRFLVGLDYYSKPEFWASAHYTYSIYPEERGVKNTFGGEINYAPKDRLLVSLSHLREEITDNDIAFQNERYRDNYKVRGLYKPSRRMEIGADYMYSHYNDDNGRNAYGIDLAYYISYEPRSLKIAYRYEEYQFDRESSEYFSPGNFHYNAVSVEWRHFLNKEEIFWGARDTYYSIRYAVNFDVKNETGHKLYFDFHHDWNDRCSSGLEWSRTIYDRRDTYSENRFMFYTKIYF